MNKLLLIVGAGMLLSLAYAGEKSGWTWEYKPLRAIYSIYSGELGEREAPTKIDRKLAIRVTGQAAKEIFDSMYPDASETCGDEKGERMRSKQNLWCSYHPRIGYRCYFGFDLRTGASIPGGDC
jgi:hypothetical protein